MKNEFNVVIKQDEDGYFVASVPSLHGCHTQAKSLDILMKRIKEAIELCLEAEEPARSKPYRTQPSKLGLKAGRSLDNIQELIAQIEGEASR